MDRNAEALGSFLKARRSLTRPDEVGVVSGARRRVAGLRREEVAALAGISADYYVRLEQGRGHRPSPQVLDALARALQLDGPTRAHLHRLASATGTGATATTTRVRAEQVPLGVMHLLETLDASVSAFVQGRFMDVLVANRTATALSPAFAPGSNLLEAAFLDPAIRDLYDDWDVVAREAVAGLRASVGARRDDPRLEELVERVSARSPEFARLWARHDVLPKVGGARRVTHPRAGAMDLLHEKLAITGTSGLLLVIHHAEPGTASATAFARLRAAPDDAG
ncbi:helix-turn-helix transcriptional regulator [Nocardioides rubriscoriae]|uniref:helix-turn-helix transcriptional regulator n=1 Tax=Nocardioides rubriscoriae TaxID=642762 RepID=UPI0011DFA989|nr:helix-turn-helix transcriptional regulator [Nocardioides rubriscoriae]